jgi:hypothetical protein
MMDAEAISNLQKREIQVPLAVCLIKGFAVALGQERALELALDAVQKDALETGRLASQKSGDNSLKGLLRIVKEAWAAGEALHLEVLESSNHLLRFTVLCCAYVDLYDRLGMREYGYCLSCSRDEPFARGFNPAIKLLRTQTIMQGASCCDFRFSLDQS